MSDQFPMSNYLVDKLCAARGGAEFILPSERLENLEHLCVEQYFMGPGRSMNLDPGLSSPKAVNLSIGPLHLQSENHVPILQPQPERTLLGHLGREEQAHHDCDTPASSKDKTHWCTQCNKQLSGSKELRRHIQTVHQGLQVQCPQCKKWFRKREDNMRRHIRQYCKYRHGDSDG
ncbi:hypothetical protein F5B19DRAFT_471300 [Rostrohypoxylon terebratum]|nr:hypothetical protein F5B19DRAFT_471300 [Rostrohypoxylon terebratum]